MEGRQPKRRKEKSMRRTENIMFHFVMVKKSTRIWK